MNARLRCGSRWPRFLRGLSRSIWNRARRCSHPVSPSPPPNAPGLSDRICRGGFTMDAIVFYLIEWMPLLIMIGLLLFIVMRTGRSVPKDYLAMATAQLDEMRRQNQTLERIAAALEKATNT